MVEANMKGTIGYLVWGDYYPDISENERNLELNCNPTLLEDKPDEYMFLKVQKIVYFEVN